MYIGSANYSDESQDNIESGTLIRDKSVIKRIFDEVFPVIMDESTPYFEDDFNIFKLFVISMEGIKLHVCKLSHVVNLIRRV